MGWKISIAVALAGAAVCSGAAHAEKRVSVGLSGGTTGGTLEAGFQINKFVSLRGGYNYFEYDFDDTYDGITYEGPLDLSTVGAFVDVHPFGNAFIITGGAFIGDKTLNMNAQLNPSQVYEIGDGQFTGAQLGSLLFEGELESTAPFLGLGFDTSFGDGPVGFKGVFGAMFTGEPSFNLTAPGASPQVQAQLATEVAQIRADVEDAIPIYPVAQIGLTISF